MQLALFAGIYVSDYQSAKQWYVRLLAGAVRGMTLEINPEWVTFNFYTHPDPADPTSITGSKLYPQMQRSADRYLGSHWGVP